MSILQAYDDASLLGDPPYQGADYDSVRVIFDEQSDVIHQSPL